MCSLRRWTCKDRGITHRKRQKKNKPAHSLLAPRRDDAVAEVDAMYELVLVPTMLFGQSAALSAATVVELTRGRKRKLNVARLVLK